MAEPDNNPVTLGGKFRLLECLETDADYAVWRAERIADFPQRVAIRLPHPDPGQPTTTVLDSLRLEQRTLAALHHAGIAALVDASLDPAHPWIAVEFAEGEPLDNYCARKHLNTDQKLALFLLVLDALAYAHRHLAVHGALSFDRIRVGEDGSPQLVGFTVDADASQPLATTTDVRAAGRLLFELLTGKAPSTRAKLPNSFCTGALRRSLIGDLDAILLRATAAEPAARYSDAGALAADLHNALSFRPVLARNGGAVYRTLRFARRNRLVAAVVLLLVLILAGSSAVVVQQNLQAARARAQAQTRLADMQRLTDSLLVQLSAELDRLQGADEVQSLLAQNISSTLDQMANEAGSDQTFRQNLAQEYLLLARLLERHPQAKLTAASAATRGLAVLEPLLREQPSDHVHQLQADLDAVRKASGK
jgi:serine/threonine protein kinase